MFQIDDWYTDIMKVESILLRFDKNSKIINSNEEEYKKGTNHSKHTPKYEGSLKRELKTIKFTQVEGCKDGVDKL